MSSFDAKRMHIVLGILDAVAHYEPSGFVGVTRDGLAAVAHQSASEMVDCSLTEVNAMLDEIIPLIIEEYDNVVLCWNANPTKSLVPSVTEPTGRSISELTEAEMHVLGFLQYEGGRVAGSFTNALIDALFKAIGDNFWKLRNAFPELGDAVLRWQNGTFPGYEDFEAD